MHIFAKVVADSSRSEHTIQGAEMVIFAPIKATLYMDHWLWMPELRGIFLSSMCEEIFKNGSNII